MYSTIKELEKNRVFYHFLELTKIPHGSYEEKALSDFIKQWAESQGLQVEQDEKYNLHIEKEASPGCEEKEALILQAHIDMVCVKVPDYEHDFQKDPIPVQLEGDILSTGLKTTLGADNGIGVAMAMAILEDRTLVHPKLHVIFTTAEEEDMSGALAVSEDWLAARRVINIDHGVEKELIAGSSGGKACEFHLPIAYKKLEGEKVFYQIEISGLRGGHSGEDIHRGLGNANILLIRCLERIREELAYDLVEIEGGTFRLAIPREAKAILACSPENGKTLEELYQSFIHQCLEAYEDSEKGMKWTIAKVEGSEKAISSESLDKMIKAVCLFPNGISEMIGSLGVVESSANLGEMYLKDGIFSLVAELRASIEENREYIHKKICFLGECLGAKVRDFAAYPSWKYRANTPLQELAKETYRNLFQEEIKILALHAGLECGCFSPKMKEMDAISIGPNMWDLHSPHEALSVSSTEKVYYFLKKLLEQL